MFFTWWISDMKFVNISSHENYHLYSSNGTGSYSAPKMFIREMFGAVLDRNFTQLHLRSIKNAHSFRVGETICAQQAGTYVCMADAHVKLLGR